MPITIEHSDINTALERFNVKEDEYYLLADTNVIYMVWCTKGLLALQLAENEECIDIDIKGEWFSYEELPPSYEPYPLVCVRYILATA